MDPNQIASSLATIAVCGDDFDYQSKALVEDWSQDPMREAYAPAILSFMESNPTLDYGLPGHIIRFLETLPNIADCLVESIARRPTPYTIWMINRQINGGPRRPRSELIAILEAASSNESLEPETRQVAMDCLEFQRKPD